MAKKKTTDAEQAIAAQIRATPTASDAQVAAAVNANDGVALDEKAGPSLVSSVRGRMGAKHTWKE